MKNEREKSSSTPCVTEAAAVVTVGGNGDKGGPESVYHKR
jgi:hypothetical protein